MTLEEARSIPGVIRNAWQERTPLIPYLRFPAAREIKIIPPQHGAITRFLVRQYTEFASDKRREISVYLDFDHALGYFGADPDKPEPYWEIYPAADGNNARFALNDTDNLLGAIALSLAMDTSHD